MLTLVVLMLDWFSCPCDRQLVSKFCGMTVMSVWQRKSTDLHYWGGVVGGLDLGKRYLIAQCHNGRVRLVRLARQRFSLAIAM